MPGISLAAISRATPFKTTWSSARSIVGGPSVRSSLLETVFLQEISSPDDHPALVLEGHAGDPRVPGEPAGAGDLAGVEVRRVSAHVLQEEIVHLLVDAGAAVEEPVLDARQRGDDAAGDPG